MKFTALNYSRLTLHCVIVWGASANLKVAFILFHQPEHLCQVLIGVMGLSAFKASSPFSLCDKYLRYSWHKKKGKAN